MKPGARNFRPPPRPVVEEVASARRDSRHDDRLAMKPLRLRVMPYLRCHQSHREQERGNEATIEQNSCHQTPLTFSAEG